MENELPVEPYPEEEPEEPFDYRGAKRRTVLWACAFWFLLGVLGYLPEEHSDGARALKYFAMIVGGMFLVRWFYLDSEEREFRMSKAWYIMLFALAIFTAPVYFFKTRGKRAWRSIGKGFLIMLLLGVCSAMGEVLMYSFAHLFPGSIAVRPLSFLEE